MVRHDMRGTWDAAECRWCAGRGHRPDPTTKASAISLELAQPCPYCEGTGIRVTFNGAVYPGGNSPLSWGKFEFHPGSMHPRRWTLYWRLAYLWDE